MGVKTEKQGLMGTGATTNYTDLTPDNASLPIPGCNTFVYLHFIRAEFETCKM